MLLVRILGFLLARLPEAAARVLAIGTAELFLLIARSRWRVVLSNLRHAFPEKEDRWIRTTGRESVRQTMEFGLLAFAMPYLSEQRLRTIFSVSPEAEALVRKIQKTGRPAVLLGPHLGPQEGHALLPLLVPGIPPLGGIYRPLDNPKLDAWVRQTRERFGTRLFSRKRGLQSGIRLLKENGWLGLFFDQNAAKNGALVTFFDRVASVTDLPGILAARHDADVFMLYTARTNFWRIEFRGGQASAGCKARETLTIEINQWLENLLRRDEALIPNWLWLHNRWRHQRRPLFSLRAKRNLLETQNRLLGRPAVPRLEPFFIHLPEKLGEVVLLLPLLRALRSSRPDAAITVIGDGELVSLVASFGLCEQAVPLPTNLTSRLKLIRRLRRQFPSAHFVFSENPRHDFDARLIGAPHRFGIGMPGRRRRHLNRLWLLPESLANGQTHPFERWEAFFRARQLESEIDRTPFSRPAETGEDAIGILCDRRWPLDRWRELISRILQNGASVRLFGDEKLTEELASDFGKKALRIVPPSTPLPDRMNLLAGCRIVVGALSGDIHLANAVGVPLVCLTPPGRFDLPVFDGEIRFFQSLDEISAEQVLEMARIRSLERS